MKAVIQRVRTASVEIDGVTISQIQQGLLVLLGVAKGDQDKDVVYMAEKITNLRIFADTEGKMNRSLVDIGGEVLLVSQFTLLGDTQKGRRPGFDSAAPPETAMALYETLIRNLQARSIHVETGKFGADMQVYLQNDGPVTFLLDSRKTPEDKMR